MKEKIIEFKTVSPLFEMERDGIKPFTTRQLDFIEERRVKLFPTENNDLPLIKIINPANNETFTRQVTHVEGIKWVKWDTGWLNIHWNHPE